MLKRTEVDGAPGVFVVISAFRLVREWETMEPGRQPSAADQSENFLLNCERQVAVEIYLTRGLEAWCDYFLRVRSLDLAEAQNFLQDFRLTPLGSLSQPVETLVGLSKSRQYITAEKSSALDQQLTSSTYKGGDPVFAIVIPVKKSARWWNRPESEKRSDIELHTQKSLPYLANVKRELYHSTGLDDLDFITYFEVADPRIFHELSVTLAAIPENEYHTRWGQPTLVGAIHSIPEAVSRLCRRASPAAVLQKSRTPVSRRTTVRTIIKGTKR
ncbi:MAG TPA: chlorite dismutase family protein [Candidatus Angelobacter sp.]|nr:chlorite dismutase family protein [Candidatus Angelobacter sp.]